MKPNYKKIRELGILTGLGWVLVSCTLIGWLIGSQLDKWLRSAMPYFTVGFLLFGAGAGFLEMFRIVNRYLKKK